MGYRPAKPPPRPKIAFAAAHAHAHAAAARPATPPPGALSGQRPSGFSPDALAGAAGVDFFLRGLAADGAARLIMAAAANGDAARLKMLLEKPDALPDFQNAFGLSPLMAAAARGHAQIVEMLAAHPLVNPGRQDAAGRTALHYAAHFDHAAAVRALLSHHAPLDVADAGGALPHEAAGPASAAVFLQDRGFTLFMKGKVPRSLKPLPAESPQPQKKEEAPLDALLRDLLRAGREFGDSPATVRTRLNALMMKMDEAAFRDDCGKIKAAKADYDWDEVFIRAAGEGNTAVMTVLQEASPASPRTLARALSAAIENEDRRDAAHHLLMWGADPDAIYETGGVNHGIPIHRQAFRARRTGAFEEMVLWGGLLGGAMNFDHYEQSARLLRASAQAAVALRGKAAGPKARLDAAREAAEQAQLLLAVRIWRKKMELKGTRAKKLREIFSVAVEQDNIGVIMAAYAEARESRLFRGRVEMSKRAGGRAIARALLHRRYEFARMLAAGGYHLKDAPAWLLQKIEKEGTARARQFAQDLLSGKMKPRLLEYIGKTRLSASDAALYTSAMNRYGRYGM